MARDTTKAWCTEALNVQTKVLQGLTELINVHISTGVFVKLHKRGLKDSLLGQIMRRSCEKRVSHLLAEFLDTICKSFRFLLMGKRLLWTAKSNRLGYPSARLLWR